MNSSRAEFQKLEATLERLKTCMPELPMASVMLSRLILHVGRGMASVLEQQIRPFGLAEAEFRVLTTLFSHPDGTAHPSELCAGTSLSPANMSRISDALVARNLITRVSSVHDRRRMVLHITQQGEDLVHHFLPMMFGPLRLMFDDFSDDEKQQLVVQLKRLGLKVDEATAHRAVERGP